MWKWLRQHQPLLGFFPAGRGLPDGLYVELVAFLGEALSEIRGHPGEWGKGHSCFLLLSVWIGAAFLEDGLAISITRL